jgi:vitamin B12 transporter
MLARFMCACAALAAAAAVFPLAARAALPSPAPSVSPGALTEIGRVSTGDRRSEPLGLVSRPTIVVDRSRIEAYGARTVADALADVPGLNLFRYGPFGAQVDYGIDGATSAQTLVLVDGAPYADPSNGGAQLEGLSTLGVERIEIVEGGASTLYGTSASGGVINIITRVPRGAYLAAATGSYADRDLRAAAGNGVFGASFERHVAANAYPYPALTYAPADAFAGGTRANAYAAESSGRAAADTTLGAGLRLRARLDASENTGGVPGGLSFLTPNAVQQLSNDGGLLEIERAARASTLTLSLSGLAQRIVYDDPDNGGEQDTYDGRVQLSLKDVVTARRGDLVAGVDVARESAVLSFGAGQLGPGSPVSATGAAQAQAAAYVQAGAAPFPGARFTAGVRAENDAPRGGVLAPSLGGVVRFGRLRVAGDLSESFRVPTLVDLYYPGFSNPNLVPEKARNADATLGYETRFAGISAEWFGRAGSNFIVLDPVTFVPYNARRAEAEGFTIVATSRERAGIEAEATFTDLYRALDLETHARLPRNPVGQATLGLTHPFGGGRVSYGLRYGIVGSDGDDRAKVAAPLTGSFDSYASLDAFLRCKMAPGVVLSVRGFDLGDDRYAPVFAYPAPGRRFSVEVSTR